MIKLRPHRFDPYKDDIAEMLGQGKTLNQIADFLADKDFNSSEPELCKYINSRGLKTMITRGYHADKVPHCQGCANYLEIGTKYINTRTSNVRVCKACLEVIPQYTRTSPVFCPRREGLWLE